MQENAGKVRAILETSKIGGIGTFSVTNGVKELR